MKIPVAKALFNSHSYSEYRKLVSDLLFEGKSTGNEQSEDLTHYSSLNETRMDRLDKTMRIPEENILKLKNLKREYIWLVISEGWCGDAAQILPIFNKMTIASEDKIEMKIVLRDENGELMKSFLTNKKKAIPRLIVINRETGSVLGSWGPRPKGATNLINDYKKEFGVIDETVKTNLQLWYLKDKGLSTQEEIINLMQNL
ncbi:thioredoxin family protein [Flavobacterium gawalongense]|uniref:Thioredoxin family protein n=1 Tax=Flavobacterium gawalongense TaxID=2594432 RepID=A0ABY3CJG6_9FLAO|nr:thioredoxin family protein [Flavobacterium gawalongense]TRX01247.1 thioredoxin family protein [Flavobacterium gawalongense]TRX05228.1 thioredoxin family protein [Flavobacterium gawalongense]